MRFLFLPQQNVLAIAFALWTVTVTTSCASSSSEWPRYLLFARPPGSSFHQDQPSTITGDYLGEVIRRIGAANSPNGGLMIGNELIFSLFATPNVTLLLQSLDAALNASRVSGIPISIVMDGQNWWDGVPELYNWWDEGKPGFDPSNVNNVEWYGPSNASAVKIGWRNWGSQIRVLPEQNILSPAVLAALRPRLQAMAGAVAKWYRSLEPEEQRLLACVKVGWEAGTQYNAYYYAGGNDLFASDPRDDPTSGLKFPSVRSGVGGGLPTLGFAAASTPAAASAGLGLKPGQTSLDRNQVAGLTRVYAEWLTQTVTAAGIPADLVVNHVGGQQPFEHSSTPVIPFAAGFAADGVPGYSFYWGPPSDAFKSEMRSAGRTRWAAAEWNLRGHSEEEWYRDFNDTLEVLDCAHISVYNWDGDFEKDEEGHAAVRSLLNSYD